MARPLRIEYEGALYHVTARGNERSKIFFTKKDYAKFREYIEEAQRKHGFILHAYVLMTNHFHFLIETPQANLSKIMHHISSSYTTYINIKRKRSGHLLQGRYKAILVDRDSYLLELSRYLHLNPVRAKMVEKPDDYPHSSYQGYVTGIAEDILSTGTVLGMITKNEKAAKERYRAFVESALVEEIASPLRKTYGGMILGRVEFIKETLQRLDDGQLDSVETSNRKALRAPAGQEEIMRLLSTHYGKSREEISTNCDMEIRKVGIYLMKKHTGVSNREIGELFGGLSYSAVAKTVQRLSKELESNRELRGSLKLLEEKLSSVKG